MPARPTPDELMAAWRGGTRRRSGVALSIWIASGLALVVVLMAAWMDPGLGRKLSAGGARPWWQQGDAHLHAIACASLACWLGAGLRLHRTANPLLAVPIVVLLAAADELAQLAVRTRSFQWGDLLGDCVGICLAVPVLALLARRRRPPSGAY